MANRFELNRKTVGEILKSQGVIDTMMDAANRIAGNAGTGFKAKRLVTRAIVVPDTDEAANDNLENNTLLKAAQR